MKYYLISSFVLISSSVSMAFGPGSTTPSWGYLPSHVLELNCEKTESQNTGFNCQNYYEISDAVNSAGPSDGVFLTTQEVSDYFQKEGLECSADRNDVQSEASPMIMDETPLCGLTADEVSAYFETLGDPCMDNIMIDSEKNNLVPSTTELVDDSQGANFKKSHVMRPSRIRPRHRKKITDYSEQEQLVIRENNAIYAQLHRDKLKLQQLSHELADAEREDNIARLLEECKTLNAEKAILLKILREKYCF